LTYFGRRHARAFVAKLVFVDRVHVRQDDRQVYFAGGVPHGLDGRPIPNLAGGPQTITLEKTDVVVQRSFSNKPPGGFANFFAKIEHYVTLISGPAISRHGANPLAFQSDFYHVHNAFRSPGELDEADLGKHKAEVYQRRYENFREGLSMSKKYIDRFSAADLEGVTFAFVCVDKGSARAEIFDLLIALRIPFIDCGLGLNRKQGPLAGALRATYYPVEKAAELRAKRLGRRWTTPMISIARACRSPSSMP
jgi:uncharacterized protein DUF6791